MQKLRSRISLIAALACGLAFISCGSSFPLNLTISASPGTINGGAQYTFTATTTNSTTQSGVTWTLALNTPSSTTDTSTPCTDQCGSITNAGTAISSQTTSGSTTYYNTVTSMTYTAPLLPPTPNEILLTAAAASNANVTEDVQFSIGAPTIVVRLSDTFSSIAPGAAPVTLNATVQFDGSNAGVKWALTANGAACSPACGTLVAQGSPSFSATYTPPASAPASPNNMPTITATSVTNSTISAFDAFTIQQPLPPISVTITNPFASINAGATGLTINATVTNDVQSQGVTWSISPTSNTGALTAATALSVLYTPPNSAPQPPYNMPTITATSVADTTKSALFTFTITAASPADSVCSSTGSFAFQLSGSDDDGKPFVAAGVMAIDAGKVMITSVDVNDNLQLASGGNIAGTCNDLLVHIVSSRGAGAREKTLGATTFHSAVISLDAPLPLARTMTGFQMTFEGNGTQRAKIGDSFDASGRPIRGEAIAQDTSTLAQFGGDFVFHVAEYGVFAGMAQSGSHVFPDYASIVRSATLGSFALHFDGAKGAISNGVMDTAAPPSTVAAVSAGALSGAATPPDSNGRGTMNLNFAGQGSRAFVYYAASAHEFVLAEMDPAACSSAMGGFNSGAIGVAVFSPRNGCAATAFSPLFAAGSADGQSLASLPKSGAGFALGIGAQNFTYDLASGRFTCVSADRDGNPRAYVDYFTAADSYWRLDISNAAIAAASFFTAP